MNELDVIVSLTTWEKRIALKELPRVLYRLLTQETQYNYKVVLVLSSEELGNDYKLPHELEVMQRHPRFEILWTYKNTRALKKLDPTMKKYPETPIITMDDDMLLKKNAIQMVMDEFKEHPKCISGTIYGAPNGVTRVGGLRIYPPHSLADFDLKYFQQYFKMMVDDEWNGLRAKAAKTALRKLNCKPVESITYGDQKTRFSKEYTRMKTRLAVSKFRREHRELGV